MLVTYYSNLLVQAKEEVSMDPSMDISFLYKILNDCERNVVKIVKYILSEYVTEIDDKSITKIIEEDLIN